MATNVLGFASLGLMVFALICTILAVALPYWKTQDDSSIESNSGLWRYCTKIPLLNYDKCGKIDMDALNSDSRAELRACRAMALMGLFGLIGSTVTLVLLLFVMKDKAILGFVSGGVSIAAGLFLMIGMAIFVGGELEATSDEDYGAGLAFCIIAWVVALAAGGLAIVAVLKMDKNAAVESKS